MDKHELVEVLGELDERLSSSLDVILIGGAARFRLDWAQKIRYFLQEQGWEID